MDLLKKLNEGETFVFDGAMGTMLQAQGLGIGECPEEWNISHADIVRRIHKAYFDAGSDIVETNTFGGSRVKLGRFGLQEKVAEFNRAAVKNARAAASDHQFVAGSVGPTGEFLEPYGAITYTEMVSIFQEQTSALADAGADILCVETMSDVKEAQAAIEAARTTKCVIFASMTFNRDKRGYRTIMGTNPATAARALAQAGAHLIGANCGTGPEQMMEILDEMKQVTSAYLLAKPNAGLPQLEGERTVYPETPESLARKMLPLISAGIRVLGGCCGTTPDHLREIAKLVKKV
jgi:5-methyltetrahydrofolate--homocysteine methyltransferase